MFVTAINPTDMIAITLSCTRFITVWRWQIRWTRLRFFYTICTLIRGHRGILYTVFYTMLNRLPLCSSISTRRACPRAALGNPLVTSKTGYAYGGVMYIKWNISWLQASDSWSTGIITIKNGFFESIICFTSLLAFPVFPIILGLLIIFLNKAANFIWCCEKFQPVN